MDTLSQDLVRAVAAVQQQTPDAQRSAELAVEAERLNRAIRRASCLTRFTDEPAHFFCSLEDGAR
ncbi:MAG: hypothetical protein J2P54_00665 [Bradyrhizobiaceae bacterium]|nr:hypothetical protein [Bradyrhizobiaceae bacterium]